MIIAAFERRIVAVTSGFQNADLERGLRKEKESYIHMFFSLFYVLLSMFFSLFIYTLYSSLCLYSYVSPLYSGIPDLALGILKILIPLCFCDTLQPAVQQLAPGAI